MAAVVQKNGMKPLVNGGLAHLDVDKVAGGGHRAALDIVHLEQPCGADPTGNSYAVRSARDDDDDELSTLIPHPASAGLCPGLEDDVNGDEPEIDIVINNVVCSFSVRCHLNLRQIALKGVNVEYRRENGMVTMKLRKPYTTASIWSSGKITCTGATSEDQSHVAARRFARCLQKLGFRTRFTNYRVVNVLGTCSMPFAIRVSAFSEKHKNIAEYEPELHPGVTYKLKKPKATLKIFSTGSITVTAPSVSDVQQAIEYIYPLVLEFRKERTKEDDLLLEKKRQQGRKRKFSETLARREVPASEDSEEEDDEEEEMLDEEDDSAGEQDFT